LILPWALSPFALRSSEEFWPLLGRILPPFFQILREPLEEPVHRSPYAVSTIAFTEPFLWAWKTWRNFRVSASQWVTSPVAWPAQILPLTAST